MNGFARIQSVTPGNADYLSRNMGNYAVEQGLPDLSAFHKHFEIASRDVPNLVSQDKPPAPLEPRVIYAQATLTGREGFSALITNLYVEPEHRRKGHGRDMMELIDVFAKQSRLHRILAPTGTWECSDLYEHCGYRQEGDAIKAGFSKADGTPHEYRFYRKDFTV
ncbi:MAG: hypothetical protein DI586_05420 [Micavibrio aeruginosavorus]|uniref:N-acetyltransferase domain-containing protein n=1 Tax=Micavibrio aeruginosavorus TaxID=349221 RepID=A0A2W5FJ10_9BACT|nr:MAG: hypothetical protein DI586_05420 [Micavibrio aeruginosavorus]